MEPLHAAHLIALGMWLGVVITEVLFEFAASDAESLRAAARFHYNVDKYGELPILVAVLGTGTMLAVRAWPLTPLHVIKIAVSLVAVGSALICVHWSAAWTYGFRRAPRPPTYGPRPRTWDHLSTMRATMQVRLSPLTAQRCTSSRIVLAATGFSISV